jgi:hypothetical protein
VPNSLGWGVYQNYCYIFVIIPRILLGIPASVNAYSGNAHTITLNLEGLVKLPKNHRGDIDGPAYEELFESGRFGQVLAERVEAGAENDRLQDAVKNL